MKLTAAVTGFVQPSMLAANFLIISYNTFVSIMAAKCVCVFSPTVYSCKGLIKKETLIRNITVLS